MRIELLGVEKRLTPEWALGPLDLEVAAGARVALLGPSGRGKSTVPRLLSGLLTPERGLLRLAGLEPLQGDWRALRRGMGYVIQEGGLFPHLTAAENAGLLARQLGWQRAHRARRLAVLAGIKTSAVIAVGTATLGALVGAGGYGQPILTGIRLADTALILEGAVPAALLALFAQVAFDGVERFLLPRPLRASFTSN